MNRSETHQKLCPEIPKKTKVQINNGYDNESGSDDESSNSSNSIIYDIESVYSSKKTPALSDTHLLNGAFSTQPSTSRNYYKILIFGLSTSKKLNSPITTREVRAAKSRLRNCKAVGQTECLESY